MIAKKEYNAATVKIFKQCCQDVSSSENYYSWALRTLTKYFMLASMVVCLSCDLYAGKPKMPINHGAPRVNKVLRKKMTHQPGWVKKLYTRCGHILFGSHNSIQRLNKINMAVTLLKSARAKKKYLRDVLKSLPRK
jgi:hypothetical protein